MNRFIKFFMLTIIALVILILIFIPFRFTDGSKGKDSTKNDLLIIAHRGASGVAPENTLPAIDSALTAKADYIEIDIHLSKDNELVVMHDETVDRTTNGNGKISDLTSEYISSLDAGSWFGKEFCGTKVPFLVDIITQVDGKSKLLIEIKKRESQYEGIEEKVISLIKKYKAEKWCVVQSFNDGVLEIINKKDPDIGLQKLIFFKFRFLPYVFDGKITRFSLEKYSYVQSINMHYLFCNRSISDLIHSGGKKINIWGCRKVKPCISLESSDWDGVITDFPKKFKDQINSYKNE